MYEQKYIVLGARIAYYRKLAKLSQRQLSEKIAISTSHLSRIERGRYPNGVSLAILFAISDGLGIKVNQLFQDL